MDKKLLPDVWMLEATIKNEAVKMVGRGITIQEASDVVISVLHNLLTELEGTGGAK